MSQPRVTPWRNSTELDVLSDWFYNFNEDIDNRQRACLKVKSYLTRSTHIPHAIEATYLLTAAKLQDTANADPSVLQLSYTMGLVRFVNGMLDPSQQSTYAIPLHTLAVKIGLPSYFVEIRHAGTHEQLPSLELLRYCTGKALVWLYQNYWVSKSYNQEIPVDTTRETLQRTFKEYRKLRKENPKYQLGDSDEDFQKLFNQVRGIHKENPDTLCDVLANALCKNMKYTLLKEMYGPLVTFCIRLEGFDMLWLEYVYNCDLYDKVDKWLPEIVTRDGFIKNNLSKLLQILAENPGNTSLSVLQALHEYATRPLKKRRVTVSDDDKRVIVNMIQEQKENVSCLEPVPEPVELPKKRTTSDDIFSDLASLKRRVNNTKDWEMHEHWTPKPFGTC